MENEQNQPIKEKCDCGQCSECRGFFGTKTNGIFLLILIVLMVIAIIIMLGDKEKYFGVAENTVSDTDSGYRKVVIDSVTFSYPKLLTMSKEGELVRFSHSIPYEHADFCDFKGDAPKLDSVVDFSVSISVVNKNLKETVKEKESDFVFKNFFEGDTVAASGGYIEPYKVGALDGYRIAQTFEGCGQYTYYFPIEKEKTLVVSRGLISDLNYSTEAEKYLKLPNIINPSQEESIFKEMLSSVTF